MILNDAKRQRRLRRIKKQLEYEQRLRIPKMRLPSVELKLTWWQRLIVYIKSFFDARPRNNQTSVSPKY